MKRIVILGSKPDASFVDAAEVWCANAAIGFYREEVRRYPVAVNVASAVILRKNLLDAAAQGGLYAKKWQAVVAARPSRLVLFEAPSDPSCAVEVREALRAAGYAAPVDICPIPDRIRLVRDIAGIRYPVVTRAFFRQPIGVQLRDVDRLARFGWKSWAGAGNEDVPGKYRPSTGILALLLAIRQHGRDAEYVVAGIGIGERWAQQGDGKVLVGKTATMHGGLTPHVHADVVVLRALARRYDLRTTEPELAHLVPLLGASFFPQRIDVVGEQAAA